MADLEVVRRLINVSRKATAADRDGSSGAEQLCHIVSAILGPDEELLAYAERSPLTRDQGLDALLLTRRAAIRLQIRADSLDVTWREAPRPLLGIAAEISFRMRFTAAPAPKDEAPKLRFMLPPAIRDDNEDEWWECTVGPEYFTADDPLAIVRQWRTALHPIEIAPCE